MSRIKSRDTKLETTFLKLLSAELYPLGYRYRKHCRKLPGNPDVVFIRRKVAIFIDGDFWHGYNLKKLGKKVPRKYWLLKIEKNMSRDKQNKNKLRKGGWKVLRFWEHQLQKEPNVCINKIKQAL